RLLAQAAMDLKRYDIADEHLQVLLKSAPEDGQVEALLGALREAQGRFKEAADWLWKATRHLPHDINNFVRLAQLPRANEGPDSPQGIPDARHIMDDLVARNSNSSAAYLARARFRMRSAGSAALDREAIAADVRRALELSPQDAEALLAAAA